MAYEYTYGGVTYQVGEFARCGVLKKWDDVSFPKALGTVVTERAIDSLLVLLITALVFVMQIPVFLNFFEKTGTSMDSLLCQQFRRCEHLAHRQRALHDERDESTRHT